MLESNSMALKEWAVVVWAMGKGSQILLLRKGGIADEEGEFRVAAKEFFLYPTYEHQQATLLQPKFSTMFQSLVSQASFQPDLCFEHYAAVTDVLPAPDLARMKRLRESFVWNDAFLDKRYGYKPDLPMYVLLVRTYSLPKPIRLPEREQYAGCRSWVELEEELPTRGATPVLAEEEFERQRENLRRQLA